MPPPFTIDYTSRDYDTIRADLLTYAQAVLPEWNTRDPNDFGVVLVELFAGAADMINYYIDRLASEAFLDTAAQRQSILEMAKLLGYTPTPMKASSVSLTLNSNYTASVVVPAGTRFFALTRVNGQPYHLYFETDADVTIPAASGGSSGVATISATQGVTISQEAVGTSDGTIGQAYALFRPNVAAGSVYVEVDETGVWTPWRVVDHVIDFGPSDAVCEVYEDQNGVTYAKFGDNVSGRVPTIGSPVRVTYRICDGALGNVAAQTVTSNLDPIIGLVGVANSGAATGGADRESLDSIRQNVPRALRALNRAVTLSDYSYLALQVGGVGKANAALTAPNTVTVYVAPTTSVAASTTVKNAVTAYLADKQMIGTTVIVGDPTYVALDVTATVICKSQYRQDYVRQGVTTAIGSVFNFDQVTFADIVVPADILTAILSVDGVATATVQVLDRTGFTGTGGVALNTNEIPTLGTLGLAMQNGIS